MGHRHPDHLLSSHQVCRRAGISYRQLDYWCRTDIIRPSVKARGSGTHRQFTPTEAFAVCVAARLAARGGHVVMEAAVEAVMGRDPNAPGVLVAEQNGRVRIMEISEVAAWLDADLTGVLGLFSRSWVLQLPLDGPAAQSLDEPLVEAVP